MPDERAAIAQLQQLQDIGWTMLRETMAADMVQYNGALWGQMETMATREPDETAEALRALPSDELLAIFGFALVAVREGVLRHSMKEQSDA